MSVYLYTEVLLGPKLSVIPSDDLGGAHWRNLPILCGAIRNLPLHRGAIRNLPGHCGPMRLNWRRPRFVRRNLDGPFSGVTEIGPSAQFGCQKRSGHSGNSGCLAILAFWLFRGLQVVLGVRGVQRVTHMIHNQMRRCNFRIPAPLLEVGLTVCE